MRKLSDEALAEPNVTIIIPFTARVPLQIRELIRMYNVYYKSLPYGDQYTISASRWREIQKATKRIEPSKR